MAKLKVFGGLTFAKGRGQVRTIVAETSQKKAAEKLDVSVNYLRDYFSVTGNPVECETALAKPGVVFMSSSIDTRDFEPQPAKR